MANSANPEINKKIATSALGTLVIATVFFYLGDRYAETLVTYPGQIFDHLGDAMLTMWETIRVSPFTLDMTSNSLLFGGACATWTTMVYARAGHPVGGNGNTQLGNQGYGANYSQKRATTDLSQIKVGMLISAQYGSNTAAGNAYGHVGIYIGDGKVMDSIYSGLRTISLSDWVSQNGRGWVVCGYPWDWR